MNNSNANEEAKQGHKDIQVLINDKLFHFETSSANGREIKAKAGIPENYSLFIRREGSNEPIADDESVELHNGEHFFSRPPSNVS